MKKYVFIYITVLSFLLCSCAKPKDTKSAENVFPESVLAEETVSDVASAESNTETVSTQQTVLESKTETAEQSTKTAQSSLPAEISTAKDEIQSVSYSAPTAADNEANENDETAIANRIIDYLNNYRANIGSNGLQKLSGLTEYSIQSYLAYYINTKYYDDKHYAWCAPFFDSKKESGLTPKLPYTSNPIDVYKSFYNDISTHDRHYDRKEIQRNTVGLLNGADIMKKKGNITEEVYQKIVKTINSCFEDEKINEYFRPLIYVIPYKNNKEKIREVDVDEGAGTLSPEYIIEGLHTKDFSVIDLGEEGLK